MSSSSSKGQIIPLPKEVVDRIAAGEVVHRPASVVKELLENSIDANSTTIEVLCQSGGLSLLNVTDDGDGIQKKDLALACTRFATSKIKHYTDLKKIQTFGFRGEALASASMVSRLTIVSRVRKSSSSSSVCAYKQTYKDGKPISNKPQPSPGNPGTSVKVHDLFYNVPNRKRAFLGAKKEAEEYNKILYITQRYAIHYAGSGISFVCRKKGSSTGGSTISSTSSSSTDLNTQCIPRIRKISQKTRKKITEEATAPVANPGDGDNEEENQKRIEACKDVICHIFGKNTSNELIPLEGSTGNILESIKASQQHATIVENDSIVSNKWFAYSVRGLISHSSYVPPKSASTFILFVNDRLVDFSALKRAVESLYDMLPKGKKPFVYLSLTVPGWHLDVNVHPTKREVAFLFEDLIIENIVQDVRKSLGGAQGSKTFYAKSLVLENTKPVNVTTTTTTSTTSTRQKLQLTLPSQTPQDDDIVEDSDNDETKQNNNRDNSTPKRKKRASIGSVPPSSSSSRKKPLDPKRFVRVNSAAPEGALEPFLVSTTLKKTEGKTPNNDTEKTPTTEQENSIMREQHDPSCEFYGRNGNPIDLTRPGAFTSIICRCQINKPTRILGGKSIAPNKQIMKKPSTQTQQPQFKVIPTDCPLASVQTLRQNIVTNCHGDFSTKLRESLFVGCVSRDLSLIQWGTELIMINHYNLAKYLFYQLALARFSGAPMAKLGGANDNSGIDVTIAIEAALQLDNDDYSNFNDDERKNKTLTHNIAEEAVKCLSEKKEMLLEYFSIKFECDTKEKNRLLLTGLPILLEGHQPQPHALPLFLLRLATEVNYRDETQCFHDVCMELGSFYREIPFDFSSSDANNDSNTVREEQNNTSSVKIMDVDSTAETFIKHTLFPALSYILVPSNESASDGTVIRIALLSSLYKVFERC